MSGNRHGNPVEPSSGNGADDTAKDLPGLLGSGGNTRWAFVLLLLLLVTRGVLLIDGAVGALGDEGSGDLFARYSEFQWVRAGQDPYPALMRLRVDAGRGLRPDDPPFPSREEISVGAFEDGDFSRVNPNLAHYPQWSYGLLAPLLLVPWPATMWLLLGLDALILGLLLRWAWSLLDGWWGWLAVFAFLLPAHSWSVGLFVGQLNLLVMGVQVLLLSALATNRAGLAAGALAWLAVKPTSTTLFGWCLLLPWLQKRSDVRFVLRSVLGVVAVVVASTLTVWLWTGTPPGTWMQQMFERNRTTFEAGYGVLPLIELPRALSGAATLAAAVAGILLQGAAVWFFRNSSLLVHFAVAGCLSRYWAYHRHYDDVLLVFLLIALVVECRRGSLLCGIALLALASAYGTPEPSSDVMAGWRVAVTILGLAILLFEHRRSVVALVAEAVPRRRVLDGLHQTQRLPAS